jgi:hypothetical protein
MRYKINFKITLLAGLLLLVTAGWCLAQVDGGKTASSSKKNLTLPNDPVTADPNPGDVLRRAYGNLLTAYSYRTRLLITSTTGYKEEYLLEFVDLDKHRVVVVEGGTTEMNGKEVIVIKDTTYFKNKPESKWESSSKDDVDNMMAWHRMARGIPNYKYGKFKAVGTEEINGIPTMVYQEDINLSSQKFWVGVRDYQLYKYERELPVSSNGKPESKMKLTWYFYDYDADIKILSPM